MDGSEEQRPSSPFAHSAEHHQAQPGDASLHFEQLRAALVQADPASAADLPINGGGMSDSTCVSGALRDASGRAEVCVSPQSLPDALRAE